MRPVRKRPARSTASKPVGASPAAAAAYRDEDQVGRELAVDRATLDFTEVTRRICHSFARALNKLDVPARFAHANHLEVDGFFDRNLIFYQGTLVIDFDPGKIAACLNVPADKPADCELDSAAKRMITMREVLRGRLSDLEMICEALLAGFAEGLGVAPQWGAITLYEEEPAERHYRKEIATDAYVAMPDAQDACYR